MWIALLCAASVSIAACSSAPHGIATEELGSDWSGERFSNLMVIGVYEDNAYRASSETLFAEVLKANGIAASPSYDLLPELDALKTDSELGTRLASTSHDGILAVATLDEGYDYEVEDYFATRGMVYLLGGRPGAATDMGSFIAWAGSGFYSLYVGLWDVKTMTPVWEVTTNSETTGSESGDTRALAEFTVQALREQGLIP